MPRVGGGVASALNHPLILITYCDHVTVYFWKHVLLSQKHLQNIFFFTSQNIITSFLLVDTGGRDCSSESKNVYNLLMPGLASFSRGKEE